jgi:regulatory protein
MIIQTVEQIQNRKIRVRLEDGTTFILYAKEWNTFHLLEGQELLEEQKEKILDEILSKRATKRAMYLLEKMDRTEAGLRQKLERDGYPAKCIDTAISYVKSFHYLDDERYACCYIETHFSRQSERMMKQKLAEKGIPKEVIENAFDKTCVEDADEKAQIVKLLEKKHYDAQNATDKEKRRIFAFLMRRGYKSADIYEILDRVSNKG